MKFLYLGLFFTELYAYHVYNPKQLYQYKKFLDVQDTSALLRRIQNRKVSEIIISPQLDEVISVDRPVMYFVSEDSESKSLSTTNIPHNSDSPSNTEKETEDDSNNPLGEYHYTQINRILLPKILDVSVDNEVQTTFLQVPETESFISNGIRFVSDSFNFLFPALLIFSILRSLTMMFRNGNGKNGMPGSGPFQMFGNGGDFMGKGVGQDKFTVQKSNITLLSWAGSPEIFNECYEIISYLRDENLFKEAGAELPRGILLEGSPGTGKTLLAKAIASEVNASFISVVGSQFVEMFVGVGAQRVRDLFRFARENKPCILFIDEIDAIGKSRSKGGSMMNDEREQTLNQLLAEMDGFQDNDGILVIGATNLKDTLDEALVRPGRFDRIIKVPLPDRTSREIILDQYFSLKNWKKSGFLVSELAGLTDGFSGAELKNLVNEAAIHAVRRVQSFSLNNNNDSKIINTEDVFQALEKILIGIVKQNDTRSLETRQRVAYHELGHAFIAHTHFDYFQLQKVSIQNTYSGVGGYTLFKTYENITDSGLYTKDYFEKRIQVALGGKACEELIYGNNFVSIGSSRDLEEANGLAKQMIENFGMGQGSMSVYSRSDKGGFFGKGNDISEKKMFLIEKEALDIVNKAYNETKKCLLMNKDKIEKTMSLLLDNHYLSGDPFNE
jgi:cell division protease FtsH